MTGAALFFLFLLFSIDLAGPGPSTPGTPKKTQNISDRIAKKLDKVIVLNTR